MKTVFFSNDYSKGAHEAILSAITKTNDENLYGYGLDFYSNRAKEKIASICKRDNLDIYLLTGGTQTNLIVIDAILNNYEGVITVKTGHINTLEAGAIERCGHRIITLDEHEGKMKYKELEEFLNNFNSDGLKEYKVKPGMVTVSYPTEFGTLYSEEELKNIYEICKKNNIPFFIDGARLGYGLASRGCDLNFEKLCNYCDVFYIGGTKVGALCGEAVVFTNNAPSHFTTTIKQHGALLAKGRLLGVQFDTLFTDNLYLEISKHAINMAERMIEILEEKGYKFYLKSPTNQQFVIVPDSKLEEIKDKAVVMPIGKYDEDSSIVRFVTSWSTSLEDVERLKEIM